MASQSRMYSPTESPLLPEKGEFHDEDGDLSANETPRPAASKRHALAIHLSFFALYTMGFLAMMISGRPSTPPAIYSPAQEVLKYAPKILNNSVNATSIYKGPKSDAIDDAWRDLFKYGNIRVTEEELKRSGRQSVQLADGSGDYLGALDVYHQLHCLKYIRHYVRGYDMPTTNVPVIDHLDHCIDSLRQYLMCRPDGGLLTFDWIPDLPGPWANFEVEHQCVDWDVVHAWSKARSVDIYDPKMLVHPELGPVGPPKDGHEH